MLIVKDAAVLSAEGPERPQQGLVDTKVVNSRVASDHADDSMSILGKYSRGQQEPARKASFTTKLQSVSSGSRLLRVPAPSLAPACQPQSCG